MPTQQDKQPVERREDGTVARGTPNPGGQPKWVKRVRESLRRLTPLARQTLRKVMKDGDYKSKVAAAKVVLEYTVPKPKQTHKIEGKGDPLAVVSPEALVEFITGKKEGR